MVHVSAPISRTPTRIGSTFALLAGIVGVMAAMAYSGVGALIALGGLSLVTVGLLLPRPRLFDIGAAGLVVGILLAGLAGGAPAVLLPGAVAAVLTWDLAHNAASHGRQVGASARTIRAEGVHALGSVAAGTVSAGAALGIYLVAVGGQPVSAVALLALASVVLMLAIRSM